MDLEKAHKKIHPSNKKLFWLLESCQVRSQKVVLDSEKFNYKKAVDVYNHHRPKTQQQPTREEVEFQKPI